MQIVLGNKKTQLDQEQLMGLVKCYDKTIADLGAGDGKFVYKKAEEDPNNFYIAVDPSEKQLAIHAKKAAKKRLPNVIFCLGSLELLPIELTGLIEKLYINMPWGSLLKSVVLPTKETAEALSSLISTHGELEINFGYDKRFEAAETKRLELPEISLGHIQSMMLPVFENNGFKLLSLQEIDKNELKKLTTTWSKKLSFGNERNIYRLVLTKL